MILNHLRKIIGILVEETDQMPTMIYMSRETYNSLLEQSQNMHEDPLLVEYQTMFPVTYWPNRKIRIEFVGLIVEIVEKR
jgi:hypothetical protein